LEHNFVLLLLLLLLLLFDVAAHLAGRPTGSSGKCQAAQSGPGCTIK